MGPMCKLSIGHRIEIDGVLSQAMEQQAASARGTAVEAEGELVEVIIEVALLNAALKRAHEPALSSDATLCTRGISSCACSGEALITEMRWL